MRIDQAGSPFLLFMFLTHPLPLDDPISSPRRISSSSATPNQWDVRPLSGPISGVHSPGDHVRRSQSLEKPWNGTSSAIVGSGIPDSSPSIGLSSSGVLLNGESTASSSPNTLQTAYSSLPTTSPPSTVPPGSSGVTALVASSSTITLSSGNFGPTSAQPSGNSQTVPSAAPTSSLPSVGSSSPSSLPLTLYASSTASTTITSLPPGVLLVTLPSGVASTDQWTTESTAGGIMTGIILGGAGLEFPVVIWGLPQLPSFQLQLPKFPCIRVFGITIIGECPPTGSSNGDGGGDGSQNSKPTGSPPTTQAQPTSALTSTAPTTTSSEPCSSRLAPITTVVCPTGGSVSSCSTIVTSVSGCSVTGSATTTSTCLQTAVSGSTGCGLPLYTEDAPDELPNTTANITDGLFSAFQYYLYQHPIVNSTGTNVPLNITIPPPPTFTSPASTTTQSYAVTAAAGSLGSSLGTSQLLPLPSPTGAFSNPTSIVATSSSGVGFSVGSSTTLSSNTQLGAVTSSISSPVAEPPPPAAEVSTTSTVNSAAAGIAAAILSVAVLPPSAISSIQSQVSLSAAEAESSSPTIATTNSASATALSTSAPASAPAPAFQTGTCRVHIYEASSQCVNVATAPVSGYIQIFDGKGNSLSYNLYTNVEWGNTVTVSKASSKLPYDVDIQFSDDTSSSKRALPVRLNRRVGGPVQCPQNWEQWLVKIQAGGTAWNYSNTNAKQLPYCNVGGWDNSPLAGSGFQSTRDSDCFWNC